MVAIGCGMIPILQEPLCFQLKFSLDNYHEVVTYIRHRSLSISCTNNCKVYGISAFSHHHHLYIIQATGDQGIVVSFHAALEEFVLSSVLHEFFTDVSFPSTLYILCHNL